MSKVIRPWHMAVALLTVATVIAGSSALNVQSFESQFCRKFAEPYGYICAEYRTQTADGYMLVVHRIGSRRRILQHRSPVPDMGETATPAMDCENQEHPFNSPACLPLQPPSNQDDIPESGDRLPPDGNDNSDDVIVDQNVPYQADQIPSSKEIFPYVGDHHLDEEETQENPPYERERNGKENSACDESQSSERCTLELLTLNDRRHLQSVDPKLLEPVVMNLDPVVITSESTRIRAPGHKSSIMESDGEESSRTTTMTMPPETVTSSSTHFKSSLSNRRSHGRHRKGPVSDGNAIRSETATRDHRYHSHPRKTDSNVIKAFAPTLNRPDHATVRVASSTEDHFLAPGPLYSAPEQSLLDGPSVLVQSEAPGPIYSSPQPSLTDGPSIEIQSEAPGPVYSAPESSLSYGPSVKVLSEAPGSEYSGAEFEPSIADGPSMTNQSEAPDQSASVPSPTRAPSVASSESPATAATSPSPSHEPVLEDFVVGRDPVLLMHQEFLNGESWFQFTESTDRLLPLLLIDAGFDVWIGHERATFWSHDHVVLHENEQSYWNWTWDDHAKNDVPAFLELINDITRLRVHYVGISQSATVGAAAATMPQSSRFMRSLILIGPTIYRGNTSSIMLDAWAFLFGNAVDQTNWDLGYQNGAFNFSREFPVREITGQGPLGVAMATISGPNCCLGSTVVSFTNGWDGTTSFKNLLHYQQGVRTNTWRHFDYRNPINNTQAYGVPYAPNYYPEDIPPYVPVLVIYGGQDAYAPPSGNRLFLSRLRGYSTSVFLPYYAHYDLSYSVTRTQDVFIPILQFLEGQR